MNKTNTRRGERKRRKKNNKIIIIVVVIHVSGHLVIVYFDSGLYIIIIYSVPTIFGEKEWKTVTG